MNVLRLAARLLLRDWRAGELRVLVTALLLAVGSVGTVGLFADRVKGALVTQANVLLGADLLISGDRPLPASTKRHAHAVCARPLPCASTAWSNPLAAKRRVPCSPT
jgi:putative ABC transport system permease protein